MQACWAKACPSCVDEHAAKPKGTIRSSTAPDQTRRRRADVTSGEPAFGGLEEEPTDGEGAVEDVAEEFFAA
jgi:hypothetical protein